MNIPSLSLHDVTALHGAEINDAVTRVVNGGWYLQGKENEKFEADYAKFIGTNYCIGCANGLDALIWIFRAYIELGIMKPGDEVIVPANTYIATILAITENGLRPVLVEPKLNTLESDEDRIEEAITSRKPTFAIADNSVGYEEKYAKYFDRVVGYSTEEELRHYVEEFVKSFEGRVNDRNEVDSTVILGVLN